jgi:hypothetical protein
MKMEKWKYVFVIFLAVVLSALTGCATATKVEKGSGVITSREATAIWNSYKILPNYHYYYYGPKSLPDYIIGIDDKYHLTSELWVPVNLTPEMLKNWFNYYEPRVGYSENPYGAFIVGPNGERLGLWYSVQDWQQVGTASLGENNQVSVTTPINPVPAAEGTRGRLLEN